MAQGKDQGNGGAQGVPGTEIAEAAGNVDKIRDILFGGQMRDYDRRFDALERKLDKELARLDEAAEKRASSFENYVKKEFEKLAAKLAQEKKDRVEAVKAGDRALKDASREFEQKLAELDEWATTESSEIRNEIHTSRTEIVADMKKLFDELTDLVRRGNEELIESKVGRAEMAGMLSEIAMRLNRDFELPGK